MSQFHPSYNKKDKTNKLAYINTVFDYFVDTIIPKDFELFKKSSQLSYAIGNDLDGIAVLYGLTRFKLEDDNHLRTRIVASYTYRTPATKGAIQDYFNIIFGYRPIIYEDFQTLFYTSSNPPQVGDKVASFTLLMPLNLLKVQEVNYVNNDGKSVTPYHFNINTDTPNAEIYYYSDHAHSSDYAVANPNEFDSKGDLAMSGLHPVGTKLFIYYDIIPDELFDTIEQTVDAYGIYQQVIDDIKAGGIEVDVAYYWDLLHDWFHGDADDLITTAVIDMISPIFAEVMIITLDDSVYSMDIDMGQLSDNPFAGSRTDFTAVTAPYWGDITRPRNRWGTGKWGMANFISVTEV